MKTLHLLLETAARRFPDRIAIEDDGNRSITYQGLNARAESLKSMLAGHGICPGDRVGIYLKKSIDSVASLFGVLKAGAAYVPVDPLAPPRRNAYIFNDCSVRAIIIEKEFADRLCEEMGKGYAYSEEIGEKLVLLQLSDSNDYRQVRNSGDNGSLKPEDLAYILYTSGSTGKPKGVMISHYNAISFVEWCSAVFQPTEEDRFSSHAPFHFDLSILDIYVPLSNGATLILIGEETGKQPLTLAQFISEKRITSWYSTPSILRLLVEFGKMQQWDYSSLRLVLFAGEVFPIKYLRELKNMLPAPRYFNLYGPTETNVCTYFEVPSKISPDRNDPYPIGKACSHVQTMVVDGKYGKVAPGDEGELYVSGASVMMGYWNLPERTERAFYRDSNGLVWYKTGDIVKEDESGDYVFIGRRDRMVKRRGYRVELGEIESVLYRYPNISEAAVVALADEDGGVHVKAFLSLTDGTRPSIIQLKKFCSENLPHYMVPDSFSFQNALPKTSTDKIDYQGLLNLT